jgi:hypothetical protein
MGLVQIQSGCGKKCRRIDGMLELMKKNRIKRFKENSELNISDVRSSNYMKIDVNWIDSSIQNYIELKQKINKDGNDPIMTQDYNAKIRILKEIKKQLKPI